MKNKKTLSTILTLSMLMSTIPAMAIKLSDAQPNTEATISCQTDAKPAETKPEEKKEETKSETEATFADQFGKFWEKSDTTTKVVTGVGIGLATLFTGFAIKSTYKSFPNACKYATPVVILLTALMGMNHMASKPANKDLIDNIKKELTPAFDTVKGWFSSAKNWFSNLNLFSDDKQDAKKEEKTEEIAK